MIKRLTAYRFCYKPYKLIALIISFQLACYSYADDCYESSTNCTQTHSWEFSLSIGAGLKENPVRTKDDIPLLLLPNINYYGKRFFFDNLSSGFTLADTAYIQINALVSLDLEHTLFRDRSIGNFFLDNPTSRINVNGVATNPLTSIPTPVNGIDSMLIPETSNTDNIDIETVMFNLDKRKMTIAGGIESTVFFNNKLTLSFQALQDIRGIHDGHTVNMALSYATTFDDHRLALTAGVNYQDDKWINYYYGLNNNETSNNNFAYDASEGITEFIKIAYQYPLSKKWALQATLLNKWLAKSITDSPIIDKSKTSTFFLGGTYHF